MSPEKSKIGSSASELVEKVNAIKEKIVYFENKKKENSLALEREKAKLEMYTSQLKELGFSYEGIDKKIDELSKEIEDAIRRAEKIVSEAGIHL